MVDDYRALSTFMAIISRIFGGAGIFYHISLKTPRESSTGPKENRGGVFSRLLYEVKDSAILAEERGPGASPKAVQSSEGDRGVKRILGYSEVELRRPSFTGITMSFMRRFPTWPRPFEKCGPDAYRLVRGTFIWI